MTFDPPQSQRLTPLKLPSSSCTIHIKRKIKKLWRNFFFSGRKNFRPNFFEKIFSEKKVEQKSGFSGEPCKFSESHQSTAWKDRFWGSVFVKKITKNARSLLVLLCQKSLFEQLLCAPFLSPKLVAKIARRQAPVLLCEIRMQQPGYLKAPSYSVFAATLPLLLLRGHVTAQRVQCGWDALSCGKTCSRKIAKTREKFGG